MKAPILNPIRFHGSAPDYNSIFPNIDNITQRSQWFEGIFPGPWFKEWLYGKDIILQFQKESETDTDLRLYKYNQTTETYDLQTVLFSGADISPVGWIGNHIYKYIISGLSEGTYYLSFADGFCSDIFTVTNNSRLKKQLIQIVYGNTDNDFGCILGAETLTQYLTGQLIAGEPVNEKSTFLSDRGELTTLRSTPQRIATLYLNDIHSTYIDHINLLFGLDYISINGIEYQTSEVPTKEDIENSDLVNLTVKLSQKHNDYYYVA